MTDIILPSTAHHKIRARLIVCRNEGLSLAEKSVAFFLSAVPSNAAGTVIGKNPTAEIEVIASVESILADPETAADGAAALAALERIGAIFCARYAAKLAAKLAPPAQEPAP